MKIDERLTIQARNILTKSVKIKKGEKIYIEGFGDSVRLLLNEFIKIAIELGAEPFYFHNDNLFIKSMLDGADENQIKNWGEIHKSIMDKCDSYIGIRGYDDVFLLSDVKADKTALFDKHFYTPVHFKSRIPNTRWCVMRYPNNTMAALSKMSTTSFEDFYFNACLVDYEKMGEKMTPLQELMIKTDKVKIIAPDTNLEFSIKGLGAIKSCGGHNIPDGEVFTAPVKDSINGVVQFNTDTISEGVFYSNIKLEFENGRIIKGTSLANDDKLQEVLDSDEGARYIGEFALGLNPYITFPILDILFDEKIAGSFHMAIGNAFDDMCNGNKSATHWDLIQMQDAEHGGGEIYFDDVLIRKDGLFVIPELLGLNPENLK